MSELEYRGACEVLAGVEFADLHSGEMPLLVDVNGELRAITVPSSPGMFQKDIEDVLSKQSDS